MSEEQKQAAGEDEPGGDEESLEGAEEESAEATEDEPDIADEEELDIEIQQVAPKQSRGCGAVGWIIVILILAAVAYLVGAKVRSQREEAAKQAREQRETSYQAQEQGINDNIQKAAEVASKGDIDGAFKQLEAAAEKWGTLASGANSAGDTQKAQYASMRKGGLKKIVEELEGDRQQAVKLAAQAAELQAKARALAKKRDGLNARVRKRILEVAGVEGGDEEPEVEAAPPEKGAKPAKR